MPAPRFDNSYARLPDGFHAPAPPTPSPSPEIIRLNEPLAATLGLDVDWLRMKAGVDLFSGCKMPESAEPIAMAYAGHQFGGWSPRLGDGRASLIGELVGIDGHRYDLQLKGSGRTRFSRGGDGKAVLGPVMREYIVSEAMTALGVPSTRALAAVTTGEAVLRRHGLEPGAVLTRIAHSHVRVGTFQYLAARGDDAAVQTLADYVIERHFPNVAEQEHRYRVLVESIIQRQADLIAHWMALGFIHGVMNTDNMQVVGETIDYGPCAFMDIFHPQKTFSSIDHHGRYAWRNQPTIAMWNLSRLAETLLALLGKDETDAIAWAESAIGAFGPRFNSQLSDRFRAKLGLLDDQPGHSELIEATFVALTEGQADMTLFFRHLTQVAAGEQETELRDLFADRRIADTWLARWRRQLEADQSDLEERVAKMRQHNPVFIPRNHRIEEAIAAGNRGDYAPFHRLVDVLAKPFDEQPDDADLERPPEPHEVVEQTFCGT